MAIVGLVIYALLETLIDLFLQGSVWIAKHIMNDSVTLFSSDQNMLNSFYELLPIGFSNADGKESFLDLAGIIDGISVAFLVLIIMSSIVKSLAAPITGEETENPVQVGIRAVIAIFLKTIIFGSSLFAFNGLLGYIGKVFTIAMSYVGEKLPSLTPDFTLGDGSMTLNPAAYIGLLILTAALVSAVLGASITYIERIITFVVSLLIGPIAVMLYASKSSSDVTKSWIQSIFAQLGAILLSLIMWALFLAQLNSALEGEGTFLDFSGEAAGIRIFKLAVAIAILSLVRNSEKIFNNIGIRTMPNAESARALLGGVSLAGASLMTGLRLGVPFGQKTADKFIHGGNNPAKGGSAFGAGDPTTGKKLYNSKGEMSLGNSGSLQTVGNYARGTVSALRQGGSNAPLNPFGKNSVIPMQNRQSKAIDHIAQQVKEGSVGSAVSGMTLKYGNSLNPKSHFKNMQEFSSAQTANMALSGRADGTGKFAFVSSTQNATQNATVNKDGSAPAGSASGLSSSVRIAETAATDGSAVKGFAGSAVFSSNGVDSIKGDYFVPTENGMAELARGQSIDIGTGVEMQLTGSKVAIDDFGGYAYEIKPVENLNLDNGITAENLPGILEAVIDKYSNDTPVAEEKTVISQQDYGLNNKEDGESYDPN